ncbi:MAG: hypothetical protein CMK59_14570 [Proteobacteria bacterium]|nr:hypothetical protein [Pseudomonadota bacterium]
MVYLLSIAMANTEPSTEASTNTDTSTQEDSSEELVKMPELLEFAQAPYPEQAKEEGREGTVLLLIEVDETGEVAFVEVLNSAGEDFDLAATEAAWNFYFSPAEDASGPIRVQIEFEYGFVLDAKTIEGAVEEEQPPQELPVNLEGSLKEMGTKRTLSEMTVMAIMKDGTTMESQTDEDGQYQFRGVPIGTTTLQFRHPSYQDLKRTVEVTENEVTSVVLWAKNLNYREDELVGVYRKPSADVTKRTISMEEVRRIPGTFGDPVRVIQNLPGAARSPFGTGGLIIRGANPEDSAVYVDGIRIPLIYHIGGYVSVINADLVDSVDYLPGSYGVHYGRSLGGVVDVKTKQSFPEENRFSWSSDILDSGGVFQGRVGKYGIAAAARRSYIDLLIPYFTPNARFIVKPRWYDYQLKIDRLEGRDKLSFFIFGFQDKLLTSTPDDFAQGTDPDSQGDINTLYSTHRFYFTWERQLTEHSRFKFTPSFGNDIISLNIAGGLRVDQRQPTAEIRFEHIWSPSQKTILTSGIDFIGGGYNFDVSLPFSFENASSFDPLAERDPTTLSGSGTGWGPDLYINAELHPLKDPDVWRIDLGFRSSFAHITDSNNSEALISNVGLDPRASTRLKLGDNSTFKGGLGIYTQPPQPFEVWRPEGESELLFERVFSAEWGLEQNLGTALQGDVSFFGKKLDRLVVQNLDALEATDLFYTNEGIGRAYGMELILRHAPVNRFFGWLSYTLSRSERNDYPDRPKESGDITVPGSPSSGEWYLFNLDQTHILVAVAGYQLPYDFGISGKFQYVTGNPFTPYGGGIYDLDQDFYTGYPSGNYNQERLPDFIALDLRIDKTFTFQKWQLESYVDFLNAIKGENPEITLYNYDFTESTYVGSLPFVPSIGIEADFYF